MTSVSKPALTPNLSSTFNINNYLFCSSPPSFNISSLLSSFDTPNNTHDNNHKYNTSDNANNLHRSYICDNSKTNNIEDVPIIDAAFVKAENNEENNLTIISTTTSTSPKATAITTDTTTTNTATNVLKEATGHKLHGVLKGTRTKEHTRKKVCFADDKGGSLVKIKVFSENNFPIRSVSFPKRRETNLQGIKQFRSCKSLPNLLELCPSLVYEIESIKLEEWQGKRKEVRYAYYSEFSQPNSNQFEMVRKLKECHVSLEFASLNDAESGGGFTNERSYGAGCFGDDKDGESKKNMMFKAKVLVVGSCSEDEVFIRLTCDKWKSYRDFEVVLERDYESEVFKSFCLLRKLNDMCAEVEESKNFSGNMQLVSCFPETVEFAIFCRNAGSEKWDNNNAKNYKFCRFCK